MSDVNGFYQDWLLSFKDAGNENTSTGGRAQVIAADGSNVAAQQALFETFYAAAQALLLGNPDGRRYISTQVQNAAIPTNGAARELKLQVFYRNPTTGGKHTMTFGTLNPNAVTYINNVGARDAISMTTPAPVVTFINAFNAFVVDPDVAAASIGVPLTGADVVVTGLKVVGRNT